MFGAAAVLWKLRERFRLGILFALYLIFAGTERFFIEFLRTNTDVALGLTAAQLESLGMIIAGAIWMIVVKGYRQAVRHRILIPAFEGSSPSYPVSLGH